jgi:protein-tyrosine phosphatase
MFRFPISDSQEDDLCADIFVGAQHLNNMISKQQMTVYVHCTSGVSRGPSLVLVYLCLYKRVKQWQNPYCVA